MVHSLEAREVTVGYGERAVLSDINLAVPQGTMGSIVGPNGSGKSTLLKSLVRLLPVSSGTVLLDGKSITTMPTMQVAKTLGILPQSPIVPEGITVWDLVSRGRYPHQGILGGWSQTDEIAVRHALDITGMSEHEHALMDHLSGGQRQRAWIALALAQETDILLLDEPTTFLDLKYQLEVLDLLSDLNATQGTTIVMVLHDLNMAARYSDWMLAVSEGHAHAYGPPREVMTQKMVKDVFGVDCLIQRDPLTGTPVMTPLDHHALAAVREGRLLG